VQLVPELLVSWADATPPDRRMAEAKRRVRQFNTDRPLEEVEVVSVSVWRWRELRLLGPMVSALSTANTASEQEREA